MEAMPQCAEGEQALSTHKNMNEEELHMVMVPYPLQGHINPMMQFAKAVIANHHVKVSFINMKHHHDRIQTSISKIHAQHEDKIQENLQGKLQFLWLDNGLPDDFDYTDLKSRFYDFHVATLNTKDPLKQLLQSLNQKSPPISCVLFGSFCPWVHTISVELGIPSVFFWTQSTSVLSIYYHTPLLEANAFFPYKKHAIAGCNQDDEKSQEDGKLVSYVPGVPPLHPSSFPTLVHVDDISNRLYTSIKEQFSLLPNCQGLIVNSFEELEKDAYQALQEQLPLPVSLVGPLVPSAFLGEGDSNDTSIGASLFDEKTECIGWLDSQRKQSVLYVSFGSLFNPSSEDLESFANGIKASKQPFLWVIRPRSALGDVADILPKGFIEDTKRHGLIIPWAPQVQVLSHPSIGAFLTHCGWNSTIESVSMGVPMIPCPHISDQPTNCHYVVELWKIGIALKRHDDGTIRSLDVERVVRTLLEEREGEEMRKRATKLREAARRAVRAREGSSCLHMEEFIRSIRSKHGVHPK